MKSMRSETKKKEVISVVSDAKSREYGSEDDSEVNAIPEDEKEEDLSDSERKKTKKKVRRGPRKAKIGQFSVNTSFCRSELELLQHVIY